MTCLLQYESSEKDAKSILLAPATAQVVSRKTAAIFHWQEFAPLQAL
jgi:hypothetical protein